METVLVSGASGLVGRALVRELRARGYDVLKLVRRRPSEPDEVYWMPGEGVDFAGDRPLHYAIHLAGETLFGLWTPEKKRRIRDSRVMGTQTIAGFCAARRQKPKALLAASAIGIYGDRGDEVLTEASAPGGGYLADLARDWETATGTAKNSGTRVVNLRIGIVLSKRGGMLAAMRLPFLLGLGGRVGDGKAWLSWIALDDLVNAIVFCMENDAISGAVNCVAPKPVTNAEFTRVLAYLLNRPALIPVPKFALRLLPGGMGEEMLLTSERVLPQRLQQARFRFCHGDLFDALCSELGISLDELQSEPSSR